MSEPSPVVPLARPSRDTVALVESVKDYAILMLDPIGRVLTWNDGAREIKGWAEDEIVGESFTRFYTPEDLASRKPWRLLEEAGLHGRVEDEGWRVRKDGARFWADVVITALRDEHDGLRGFVKVVRDLTDRRAAEERLRESEQRLRLLIESVEDYAIFMLDPDGRIASWNSGAERIKGWTAQEAIGRSISIFYPSDGGADAKAREMLRIAASVGRVEDEGWRLRKDGTRFWADAVLSRIESDDGRIVGFSKVTRDLTARRAADQALRESEERTRLMIASVRDYAIFMLDPEGRVASWNPGAERLKGYAADEVIGRRFEIFYPEDDRRVGKPELELRVAERDGRYEEEGWRIRKNGSRFWANVVISAVRNAAGVLVGFTKVTRDQTEYRLAARRLEARARQQAATAALGLAALREREPAEVADRVVRTVQDVLGTELVVVLSRGPEAMTVLAASGWTDSVVGMVVPVDPSTLAGRVEARRAPVIVPDFAVAQLVPSALEHEHGARSGAGVVIPAADPAAPPYGVLLALRHQPHELGAEDVSFLQGVANVIAASMTRRHDDEQLRLAQVRLAEQVAHLEHAQRAVSERDEFISVASHELRTPLNALQLNLQGLSRALGPDLPDRARTRIDGALRQTQRLAHLIERLLDVSRIVSGRVEIVREPVDLGEIASDVIDSLRETALQAGCAVSLEASPGATGAWDRTRIEQIAMNLVSNAIKYGAGKPISLRVGATAERAWLTVADQGIGIAPEDVDRIFGRFERAVSVRNFGGLGLGLYIAQYIVDAHGGAIRVESAPGEGARFTVELPREAGHERLRRRA